MFARFRLAFAVVLVSVGCQVAPAAPVDSNAIGTEVAQRVQATLSARDVAAGSDQKATPARDASSVTSAPVGPATVAPTSTIAGSAPTVSVTIAPSRSATAVAASRSDKPVPP